MPEIISKKKSKKKRCAVCKKKLNLCPFQCRCDENKFFCSKHICTEAHNCTFDYKLEQKENFEKNNPKVAFKKVNKI